MSYLSEQILEETKSFPEGAPIAAKGLLHLGTRAAVDQALSRLARRSKLMRLRRGVYLRPVESRFGKRAPSVEKVVEAVEAQGIETVVPSGAAAANKLGLTQQVPVRSLYLTSGPSREMRLGRQLVKFRHVPRWQVALAGRRSGDVIRALTWAGPKEVHNVLRVLRPKLTATELRELKEVAPRLPTWLAKSVSSLRSNG